MISDTCTVLIGKGQKEEQHPPRHFVKDSLGGKEEQRRNIPCGKSKDMRGTKG